jgi:diguanylate cyclase (GGDEF)-like protein/PAS domain S-box-containing protein
VPIIHNQKLVGSVFALLNFYDDFQQLFADKAPYNQISISYHNLNYHHYNPVLYAYKDHKASMLHESFQIKYIRELWVSKTQHFDVELFSSEWFIKHHYSWLVWSMIVGGLFFCIVMEILLLIVYGQKEIIQTKVDMQAALLEKEEKTNLLLLQSAGEGILGVDHKGMITFANPAMVQLLGYPSNALVNQHINQLNILVSNDKGQPVIEKQGSCLVEMNTKANRVACKIQKRQGDWIWVEVMNTLVSDNDANGHVVLLNDITEKKEAGDKLEKMAHYDQLTGLPNRTSFLTYLEQAIKRAERSSENIAVCFLDMDNFKYINDHWGHQLGDEVLKKIPILLAPFQRESDYLARLSGDEFGLVLHDITSADMATTAVKRYLNAFNESLCIEKNEIKITFSVGVAIYPTGGSTAEELIKNADIAMYKAKDRGKNTYAFFNQEASKQIQRYHLINDAFAHALTHHEFYLLYQPQIDVKTNELYGVEALIRWKHPKLGEIMPSEFILVAENTGVIKEIGRWLLKQIAKDYQQLISINKDLKISVNVSIKQLEDKEFELHVHDFMEQHVKPENITIEVTETALMHNFKMISALMFRLSQLGIGFALDDFGMEYSSLNYLKNLDINCIKIDKNFVRDMCDNNVSAAIVQAIIKLANALDVTSIAEGVETQSQYNFLAENACDYIQGYYFSKPIALNELIDKYH